MQLFKALPVLAFGVSSALGRFCGDNYYGSLYNITQGVEYWSATNLKNYTDVKNAQECADKCTQWNTNNTPECIIGSWDSLRTLCYLKDGYSRVQRNSAVTSYFSVCCAT